MYPYDIIVVIQSWAALVEGSSRIQNASGDGKSIRYWEAPNPNKTMSLRFNSPAFGSISFYFQDSVCSQTVRMISRRKYQYIKHHIFGWTLSIAIITADVPVMFIYFAVHQVTNLLMRNHIKYHLSPRRYLGARQGCLMICLSSVLSLIAGYIYTHTFSV